jgi:hypothetical protein
MKSGDSQEGMSSRQKDWATTWVKTTWLLRIRDLSPVLRWSLHLSADQSGMLPRAKGRGNVPERGEEASSAGTMR